MFGHRFLILPRFVTKMLRPKQQRKKNTLNFQEIEFFED
jgi:hypothetical protein